ncbi:universal stress protein [Desulfobacula sp.]
MDENKILFPYNFTDMDKKALDFIIQTYVCHENVHITLFHTYAPVPEIIVSRNSVMEKMSTNLHYLRQKVMEQESRMVEVRQHLLNSGFQNSQVDYLYLPKKGDLTRGIIMLARDKGYNTIVLSRAGTVAGFFKTSVSNKVVTTLKDVNITIIT